MQNSKHTSLLKLSGEATIHCLTGCAIGEFIGLFIGVSMGFPVWMTISLATILGFVCGYTLGLLPLVRQGNGWIQAFRIIWIGETISIGVMEFAMNLADYLIGGMAVASVLDFRFWLGYVVALPAGFVAAWPVNYWLLKRNLKQHCH